MNRFGTINKALITEGLEPTTLDAHSCGFHQVTLYNHQVIRPEGRPDYQIIYITKGLGSFTIDGTSIELTQGQLILYPPGSPQMYHYLASKQTAYYWMHFVGVKNHLELEPLFAKGPKIIDIGVQPPICDAFEAIISEFINREQYYTQISNHYLYTLLLTILRHHQKSQIKHSTIETNIHETANYMRNHYAKKNSLQVYADYSHLSISRFITNFQSVFNQSPMKYLKKIRLENAAWLLLNTSQPISDIAISIGYDDPLYFSRAFKKEYHISPTAYRKLNTI